MRNSLAIFLTLIACGSSLAQTSVVGAPRPSIEFRPSAASSSAQEGLKYRDPKDPLTLGEVANMQRLKEAEDFLNKHGYTTIKPKDPVAEEAAAKPAVEPPPSSIKIVAIYGLPTEVRAEIDHDGLALTASVGQRFGPYRVEAVDPSGVKLQSLAACAPRARRHAKASGSACTPSTRALAVGDIVEWKR